MYNRRSSILLDVSGTPIASVPQPPCSSTIPAEHLRPQIVARALHRNANPDTVTPFRYACHVFVLAAHAVEFDDNDAPPLNPMDQVSGYESVSFDAGESARAAPSDGCV